MAEQDLMSLALRPGTQIKRLAPDNPYEPFFGGVPAKVQALHAIGLNEDVTHENPEEYWMELYRGRNEYLRRIVMYLTVTENMDPITTVVLPVYPTTDRVITWSKMVFDVVPMSRMPHEGVPRLLTYRRERMATSVEYRGIGLLLEHNFTQTPEGQQVYAESMNGIAESMRMTLIIEALSAISWACNPERQVSVERRPSLPMVKALEEEKSAMFVLQMGAGQFRTMLMNVVSRMTTRSVRVSRPDVLIVPPGFSVYYDRVPVSTKYPAVSNGEVETKEGPMALALVDGFTVFEIPLVYQPGSNNQPFNPFRGEVQVGEYYTVLDPFHGQSHLGYESRHMTSWIYREPEVDDYARIGIESVLDACRRWSDGGGDSIDNPGLDPAHEEMLARGHGLLADGELTEERHDLFLYREPRRLASDLSSWHVASMLGHLVRRRGPPNRFDVAALMRMAETAAAAVGQRAIDSIDRDIAAVRAFVRRAEKVNVKPEYLTHYLSRMYNLNLQRGTEKSTTVANISCKEMKPNRHGSLDIPEHDDEMGPMDLPPLCNSWPAILTLADEASKVTPWQRAGESAEEVVRIVRTLAARLRTVAKSSLLLDERAIPLWFPGCRTLEHAVFNLIVGPRGGLFMGELSEAQALPADVVMTALSDVLGLDDRQRDLLVRTINPDANRILVQLVLLVIQNEETWLSSRIQENIRTLRRRIDSRRRRGGEASLEELRAGLDAWTGIANDQTKHLAWALSVSKSAFGPVIIDLLPTIRREDHLAEMRSALASIRGVPGRPGRVAGMLMDQIATERARFDDPAGNMAERIRTLPPCDPATIDNARQRIELARSIRPAAEWIRVPLSSCKTLVGTISSAPEVAMVMMPSDPRFLHLVPMLQVTDEEKKAALDMPEYEMSGCRLDELPVFCALQDVQAGEGPAVAAAAVGEEDPGYGRLSRMLDVGAPAQPEGEPQRPQLPPPVLVGTERSRALVESDIPAVWAETWTAHGSAAVQLFSRALLTCSLGRQQFEDWIKADVVLPCEFLLERPFITLTSEDAVAMKGGYETGFTIVGRGDFMIGTDAATKTHIGNFTADVGAAVHNAGNVWPIRHARGGPTIGGLDVRMFRNPEDLNDLRSHRHDIFVNMVAYGELHDGLPNPKTLNGRCPDPTNHPHVRVMPEAGRPWGCSSDPYYRTVWGMESNGLHRSYEMMGDVGFDWSELNNILWLGERHGYNPATGICNRSTRNTGPLGATGTMPGSGRVRSGELPYYKTHYEPPVALHC
jgi:hypothetical protein